LAIDEKMDFIMEKTMVASRTIFGGLVAACAALFLCAPSAMAEHLDRHETRRLVRRIEERCDVFQDKLDDWVAERQDERFHLTSELYHHIDEFQNSVDDYKVELRDQDDPWSVRDQAHVVVDKARELGRIVMHGEIHDALPGEIRREWQGLRQEVDHFAHEYRMPPVEW
jgi:hypothetical protein